MSRRRGFTLIELLIVIGIVALLIAATLVVGAKVIDGGRVKVTADTIRILDASLAGYMADKDDLPPALVPDKTTPATLYPAADARDMSNADATARPPGYQVINSIGLYVLSVSSSPKAKSAIDGINSKFVSQLDIHGQLPANASTPVFTTILDAWGHPIRYVHPVFDTDYAQTPVATLAGAASSVANIRRTSKMSGPGDPPRSPATAEILPDADGGTCTGNRPYFYSMGPDERAGRWLDAGDGDEYDFDEDNVYTTRPGAAQ